MHYSLTLITSAGIRTAPLSELSAAALLEAAAELGINTVTWDAAEVRRLVDKAADSGEGMIMCAGGSLVVRRA
ncbi:hypothetical protein [Mycolicibacter arupensis]|jgi:diacylglycerol kinase family enzyme|uniref:Uncharacterized protein n=1 Tax=Mycolicibacter arupensis TaxID=342002 RepID=A0A5C7Y1N2_9MYCO|nr:hypothetical protein [Mycolicibacter arupensis]TXI55583.1 MAG: hypothetical protein E6Q54_12325 [Mycolicibacter arupensis]